MGFPVFPLNWLDLKTNEVSKGYKEAGYFSETVTNMLALLGWNAGTEQEIFSLDELIAQFDLSRVSKSGAKFDPEKTKWFQHQYMQLKSDAELADLFLPILKTNVIASETEQSLNKDYITKVISLTKERATFVSDFWDLTSFFFIAPNEFDEKAVKKQWKDDSAELMQNLIDLLKGISDFNSETIENSVKNWITTAELSFGKIMQPFRLSLVGALKGPHLFDIAALIGKEETVKRLFFAIDTLGK
jgi:glutamyl-tRNA synthetase